MTLVQESALTHARPVVTAVGARKIIVGFTPANNLACGQRSLLDFLVLVRLTPMFAPAAFAFTLLAVVMRVGQVFIFHFKNLIISESLLRLFL